MHNLHLILKLGWGPSGTNSSGVSCLDIKNICRTGAYLEQFATWIVEPLHSSPPHRATGPLHERDRHTQLLTEPSPSSWLQCCQGAHWLKPPSCVRFLTSREDWSGLKIHAKWPQISHICLNAPFWSKSTSWCPGLEYHDKIIMLILMKKLPV